MSYLIFHIVSGLICIPFLMYMRKWNRERWNHDCEKSNIYLSDLLWALIGSLLGPVIALIVILTYLDYGVRYIKRHQKQWDRKLW